MLEWNDEKYSIGIPDIDRDHRDLFEAVTNLAHGIREGHPLESFEESLVFLQDYVTEHFYREEKVMQDYLCPAYSKNKQEHLEFQSHLKTYKTRFESEGMSFWLLQVFVEMIAAWLRHHVLEVDMELRRSVVGD